MASPRKISQLLLAIARRLARKEPREARTLVQDNVGPAGPPKPYLRDPNEVGKVLQKMLRDRTLPGNPDPLVSKGLVRSRNVGMLPFGTSKQHQLLPANDALDIDVLARKHKRPLTREEALELLRKLTEKPDK